MMKHLHASNVRIFTYLCTPITDVKCLEFPAIKFVKMNSNLVLFDLVRMWRASVTPRSCWKNKHMDL